MTSQLTVSNSEIGTWLRCRRQWALRYVWWLAPHEEPAADVKQLGRRVHQALEGSLKSGGTWSPSHMARQLYDAEILMMPEFADEIRKERDLAVVMLEGYEEWAAETGLDEGVEVLAAESDVRADMPGMPGVVLRGRLDQMIRRTRDGVVLFRDWKTVGTLSAASSLPLAIQPRFYTLIQRLASGTNDARVDGGQVVYLLRSKRTARATPPFYALAEVRYNRDDLNSVYLRTRAVVTEMLRAREMLRGGFDHREIVPATPMGSCSWDCPFTGICPMMDDGSRWQDAARYEYRQEDPYSYYDRQPGDVIR